MAYSKKKIKTDYGVFAKQYARKKYPNHDPNDRWYDRKLEAKIQRMKPEELAELLSEEEDE